jgi:hypothetical protein
LSYKLIQGKDRFLIFLLICNVRVWYPADTSNDGRCMDITTEIGERGIAPRKKSSHHIQKARAARQSVSRMPFKGKACVLKLSNTSQAKGFKNQSLQPPRSSYTHRRFVQVRSICKIASRPLASCGWEYSSCLIDPIELEPSHFILNCSLSRFS